MKITMANEFTVRNETNRAMIEIVSNYLTKSDDVIIEATLWNLGITCQSLRGRDIRMNTSANDRALNQKYFYMNERVNGKSRRIPKQEWAI